MFMKRGFYLIWDYLFIIQLGIIIIPQFVISNFSIFISHIFAYVDIIIFILTAIYIIFLVFRFKFILGFVIKLVFMILLRKLQSSIFFQLFFKTLFQVGSRHLQHL